MGNRIYIDEVYKEDSKLYGFHAYDDHESSTAFNWEKTPDDDIDWFYAILTCEYGYPDAFGELIQFARECEKGITIRNTYYDWSELEPTYKKAMLANLSPPINPPQ
jgi:hypothetical protein